MKVTRTSAFTGVTRTLDLNISEQKLQDWEEGELLAQDAFPNLDDEEREFIMTGITPEEWNAAFGEEE
tara:strand:- start:274 stop:477 length:204 start_codon:yes stop_codon:yes gene_type:complete